MWEEQTIPNPTPANCPHLPPLSLPPITPDHNKQTGHAKGMHRGPACLHWGHRKVQPYSLPFAPPSTPLTHEQGTGMARAAPPICGGGTDGVAPFAPPFPQPPLARRTGHVNKCTQHPPCLCRGRGKVHPPFAPQPHSCENRMCEQIAHGPPTLYMPSPLHANTAPKWGEGCARPCLHTPSPVCCTTPRLLFTCPPLTPPCLPRAQGATPFPSTRFLHPIGE